MAVGLLSGPFSIHSFLPDWVAALKHDQRQRTDRQDVFFLNSFKTTVDIKKMVCSFKGAGRVFFLNNSLTAAYLKMSLDSVSMFLLPTCNWNSPDVTLREYDQISTSNVQTVLT